MYFQTPPATTDTLLAEFYTTLRMFHIKCLVLLTDVVFCDLYLIKSRVYQSKINRFRKGEGRKRAGVLHCCGMLRSFSRFSLVYRARQLYKNISILFLFPVKTVGLVQA